MTKELHVTPFFIIGIFFPNSVKYRPYILQPSQHFWLSIFNFAFVKDADVEGFPLFNLFNITNIKVVCSKQKYAMSSSNLCIYQVKVVLKGQKQKLALLKSLSDSDQLHLSVCCIQVFLCKIKQDFRRNQSYWLLHCNLNGVSN